MSDAHSPDDVDPSDELGRLPREWVGLPARPSWPEPRPTPRELHDGRVELLVNCQLVVRSDTTADDYLDGGRDLEEPAE